MVNIHKKEGIELRLTRRRIYFLFGLIAVASIALVYFYFGPKPVQPLTSIQYYNTVLNFRADLREANKVPVYPYEQAVRNEFMNQLVENVTFVFKPSSGTENAIYRLEIIEIIRNLNIGYSRIKTAPHFNVVAVSSYDDLFNQTMNNPVIALVGPTYTNETSVTMGFHTVYIRGTDLRNFDLATEKFLMAALDIKI